MTIWDNNEHSQYFRSQLVNDDLEELFKLHQFFEKYPECLISDRCPDFNKILNNY